MYHTHPGVQSTCAYYYNQVHSKRWWDYYDAFAHIGKKPSWHVGDNNGVIY